MVIGSWFDEEKLLPGERLVRSSLARLRSDATPRWWEGQLILTTDRLFFLPFVENPLTADVAFWVRDIVQASRAGRNRLFVQGDSYDAILQLRGARPGLAVSEQRGNTAFLFIAAIQRHWCHASDRPSETKKSNIMRAHFGPFRMDENCGHVVFSAANRD